MGEAHVRSSRTEATDAFDQQELFYVVVLQSLGIDLSENCTAQAVIKCAAARTGYLAGMVQRKKITEAERRAVDFTLYAKSEKTNPEVICFLQHQLPLPHN